MSEPTVELYSHNEPLKLHVEATESNPDGFDYFVHDLNARTSAWDSTIENFHSETSKYINGLLLENGKVLWSDQATASGGLMEVGESKGKDMIASFLHWLEIPGKSHQSF